MTTKAALLGRLQPERPWRDRTPWIRFTDSIETEPHGGVLWCQRCGEKYDPRMPIPLSLFVALIKAFQKEHRHCRERK